MPCVQGVGRGLVGGQGPGPGDCGLWPAGEAGSEGQGLPLVLRAPRSPRSMMLGQPHWPLASLSCCFPGRGRFSW